MVSTGHSDAYFTVPLHPDHYKYIRFLWQGSYLNSVVYVLVMQWCSLKLSISLNSVSQKTVSEFQCTWMTSSWSIEISKCWMINSKLWYTAYTIWALLTILTNWIGPNFCACLCIKVCCQLQFTTMSVLQTKAALIENACFKLFHSSCEEWILLFFTCASQKDKWSLIIFALFIAYSATTIHIQCY